MVDLIALTTELDTKGVKVFAGTKNNEAVVSLIYANIVEAKETIDGIVSTYVTGYNIVSTLEGQLYKCSCNLL